MSDLRELLGRLRAKRAPVDHGERRRLVRHRPRVLGFFAGRSHPALGERIAQHLGVELGDVELRTFENGETYCRYRESIREADVFVLQSCAGAVNDEFVELLLMVDAARRASAHSVTAVMPWFPYARQDRKAAPREPISARLLATLLEAAGADRVVSVDLHTGQVQGFFSIPVDHATALPLFARHLRERELHGRDVVVASPDLGRLRLARRLSRLLDCDVAVVSKTRPRADVVAAGQLIGDVRGRTVILGDDMIVTGGTLLTAVRTVLAAGASDVAAFGTLQLASPEALTRLLDSELSSLVVTDTASFQADGHPKLTVLSVAPLLAETIEGVFAGSSVSALFAGQETF